MEKYKEGFRRLSIAVGILGVIAWIIFFIKVGGFGTPLNKVEAWEWILLIVFTFVSYLIPHYLIKGIYWVLAGFSQKNQ